MHWITAANRKRICLAILAVSAAWQMDPGHSLMAQTVDFQRDILPVFSNSCFSCHGPDAEQRQSGLRLDVRDEAIDYGAIDPDDPEASLVLERIFSGDPDIVMPPPDSRPPLTDREKKLIRAWIGSGAEYKKHWAWETPVRPAVPQAGEGWALNPVDRFIARRLEQNGMKPSPRANPETLVRRLSLDLVGLPPDGKLQETAGKEFSVESWEAVVGDLLASPHYGERMAAAWLDVVRYSDTVGYHGDQNINVFPYRDWVIKSINDNMPFDQFARWQLAGDLIEHPTEQSRTASAFNRLNMVTREGGAQPGEYLAKYSADRVRAMGSAFLGMTIACAECHDHKFDPISTRDFYTMAAFFADLKQWGVYQDYGYTPNPDLRGWSNDHPFPPELEVASEPLSRRAEQYRKQREDLAAAALTAAMAETDTRQKFQDWLDGLKSNLRVNDSGWVSSNPVQPPTDAAWELEPDGVWKLTGKEIPSVQATLRPATGSIASVRLELLGEIAEAKQIVAGKSGQSTIQLNLQRVSAADPEAKPKDVKIFFADARQKIPRYSNGFEIDGVQGGWVVRSDWPAGTDSVWVLDQPLQLAEGETLELSMTGNVAPRIRVSVSPLVPVDPRNSTEWSNEISRLLSGEESPLISYEWVATGAAGKVARDEMRKLDRQIRDCRDGVWPVVVSEALPVPMETRVLLRGDWQDTTGEIVMPRTPGFLPPGGTTGPDRRLTRLDLANWLVQPDHPLTARVQMNRLWKHFFGTGLSAVLDDLGAQGQHPSHPELLDWLAVEFRESGWDMKHMVRLIVESATYQQSSRPSEQAVALDPDNGWLSHQNPRRLEAEIIRDNALAIAGLLDAEFGGPPAFPYQPDDYYSQLQFPDRRYRADDDDQQYRRGIYMHWQRTFLHPMLANFDAPSREECTGMRIEANTPLQALTLLNDPTFVEAARKLAELSMKQEVPVASIGQNGDGAIFGPLSPKNSETRTTTGKKSSEFLGVRVRGDSLEGSAPSPQPSPPKHWRANAMDDGLVSAPLFRGRGGRNGAVSDGANDDPAIINWLVRRVLGRDANEKEIESLSGFLVGQRLECAKDEQAAAALLTNGNSPADESLDKTELAARTELCRVLLNLHETITRY